MRSAEMKLLRSMLDEITEDPPKAGDVFPTETEIAQRFNVGRGLAQNLISTLEERQVLRRRTQEGITVNVPDQWDLKDREVLFAMLRAKPGHPYFDRVRGLFTLVLCEGGGGLEYSDPAEREQILELLDLCRPQTA